MSSARSDTHFKAVTVQVVAGGIVSLEWMPQNRIISCRSLLSQGLPVYREDLYFVDRFPASALHCQRGAASREAHNVRNEVVTVHRSQAMLKMLSLYTQISFAINFFVKTQVQQSLDLQHTRHKLLLDRAGLRGLDVDSVSSTSDYFACFCIPASETTLQQERMSVAHGSQLRRQTVETSCKSEPW
jgi:hypothetical protein